jgi:hypothetical protein
MLTFQKIEHESGGVAYSVIHDNGVEIGSLYMEVDGYWVFYPIQRHGYWDANTLIKIARRLHKMNRKWHAQVCAAMESVNGDEASSDISYEPFNDLSR